MPLYTSHVIWPTWSLGSQSKWDAVQLLGGEAEQGSSILSWCDLGVQKTPSGLAWVVCTEQSKLGCLQEL